LPLGQGVRWVVPKGNPTPFTETLGAWSLWVFGIGAFFILFSTLLSAIGAGASFPTTRSSSAWRAATRCGARRGSALTFSWPILAFVFYAAIPQPILLVTIGAVTQALMLPVQSGATLWLHRRHLDPRLRPSRGVRCALYATFCFQLAMALLLIRFTIL
jgi:hypothetical protein